MHEFYSDKSGSGYFDYARTDVVEYLKSLIQSKKIGFDFNNVLDVGCGGGATGELVKKTFGAGKYTGIELMPEVAKRAESVLDKVYTGNVEELISNKLTGMIEKEKFSIIFFLDSLEHMYNPWEVLKTSKSWLKDDGYFILSIPNAGHISFIKRLLTDNFKYEKSGLFDFTHIRFFTYNTIKKMVEDCGCEIVNYSTLNDLSITKIKIFNLLTFSAFKKQFISSYTLVVKKKKN